MLSGIADGVYVRLYGCGVESKDWEDFEPSYHVPCPPMDAREQEQDQYVLYYTCLLGIRVLNFLREPLSKIARGKAVSA